MIIAVASGKGGTGKTTVATSLALVASERRQVRVLDCDVEAPNVALFLNPQMREHREVGTLLPFVEESRCTYCGQCTEVCQYHAIALVARRILVFPELCHGCGSCSMICPENAISERLNVSGILDRGTSALGIEVVRGTMNIGEAMAAPIIRDLKTWAASSSAFLDEVLEIRDSPPGASCSVVESLRGADFVLLVTEPTPFGLHDLKQIAGIVRELRVPAGVVVNRDGIGDDRVDAYCAENKLPIVLRIPMNRHIAEALDRGQTLIEAAPEYRAAFAAALDEVTTQVAV